MTWLFIKSPSKPDSPRPRPLCTLQVLCKPCLRFCSRRVTGIIAHPSFITLLWMTFLCSLLLNEVGERVTPLGQAPGVACGITISLPPSPGGPPAQVSRCRAAAMASLHPLSVPPATGQRLLPGRGRPGEAGQPSGNSPSCGEDNLERGGSSAVFRSPGQLSVPGPLPALLLLRGILRGRQRLGSVSVTPLIAMEVVGAWAEARGLGRLMVSTTPSRALPFARFCAEPRQAWEPSSFV